MLFSIFRWPNPFELNWSLLIFWGNNDWFSVLNTVSGLGCRITCKDKLGRECWIFQRKSKTTHQKGQLSLRQRSYEHPALFIAGPRFPNFPFILTIIFANFISNQVDAFQYHTRIWFTLSLFNLQKHERIISRTNANKTFPFSGYLRPD